LETGSVSSRRALKSIHLASIIWIIACVGFISILALREEGFNWWFIFSLSGYSALVIFLVVSLYLFAGKTQQIEAEHPLTTTNYYMAFYVNAPFLGALAGILGMLGTSTVTQFCVGVCLGTVGTTFFVWVVLDQLVGLFEMVLPGSRKHRAIRLATAAAERKRKHERAEQLLLEVLTKEQTERCHWQQILRPEAEKLAALLDADASEFEQAEQQAIDIGANAWQIGGLSCMRELRNMAMAISKERKINQEVVDYISVWWNGIGNWRRPSLG
jgi:hypothetical protein